jgi:tetratricopeptide (TPR) repeat protein
MIRSITHLALIVVVAGMFGCSSDTPEDQSEAASQTAFATLAQRFEESEDDAEKASLAEDFLASYPDTEHTGPLAELIAEYRGGRLGDPERACRVMGAALEEAENPDNRFRLAVAMAPLAQELGRPFDLGPLAADLAAHRELTYADHAAIMEAAEKVGDWQLAEHHADAGLAFATGEAFQAEYPDHDFGGEELAVYAAARRASSLAYMGWAAFNQGRVEDGMALLDEASDVVPRGYMGAPDAPVDLLLGRALLASGDAQRAVDVLSPGAVFGDATNVTPLLEQAYSEVNGPSADLQEYLKATRTRLARQVDDVELPDYRGAEHALSDLSGRVVLLTFWFPT